MPTRKQEHVSASFHYLRRWRRGDEGERTPVPFGATDFDNLWTTLRDLRPINLRDEASADRVRLRQQIPLEAPERVNPRTVFGRFRTSYWGHAYENSEKGKISADSISLRPFFYVLYISESGDIYVGAQYLGQFGGYDGLRRTLLYLMHSSYEVTSHSFRVASARYRNVEAKEVRVAFTDRSTSLERRNAFGKSGVVTFRQTETGDSFAGEVRSRLVPQFGRPADEVKRVVADMVRETQVMALEDTVIDDCTIIGTVNGRRKSIELIAAGDFATRFPMQVRLDRDGHPIAAEARDSMLKLLEDEIIARREDV